MKLCNANQHVCSSSSDDLGEGHLLLANIVSEVCDSVLGIADKLRLGLSAVVFFTLNVGQNSRDLTVCRSEHGKLLLHKCIFSRDAGQRSTYLPPRWR